MQKNRRSAGLWKLKLFKEEHCICDQGPFFCVLLLLFILPRWQLESRKPELIAVVHFPIVCIHFMSLTKEDNLISLTP